MLTFGRNKESNVNFQFITDLDVFNVFGIESKNNLILVLASH